MSTSTSYPLACSWVHRPISIRCEAHNVMESLLPENSKVPKDESEESFDQKWFSVFNKREQSDSLETGILKSISILRKSISKPFLSRMSQAKKKDDEDQSQSKVDVANKEEQKTEAQEEAKAEGEAKAEEEAKTEGEAKIEGEAKPEEGVKPQVDIKAKTDELDGTGLPEVIEEAIPEPDEITDTKAAKMSSIAWGRLSEMRDSNDSRKVSVLPLHPHLASGRGVLRTYFMQVCQMNPGSTFGFGENMRDRRMVALTPVTCMLMPKVWLLQRNTANIWTRIQYYLEKKIPPKAKLFEEFQKQRDWLNFREERLQDVLQRTTNVNNTSVHDVPYAIRLDEMVDI